MSYNIYYTGATPSDIIHGLSREDLDSSVNSLEFGLKYSIYDLVSRIELYKSEKIPFNLSNSIYLTLSKSLSPP